MIGVVNATRLDFDRKLNWSTLGNGVSIYYDPVGSDPTDEMLIERAVGKVILITKEIPITPSLLARLPTTVRVICEAGTGFNNIALDVCTERGIKVMNVPSYSSSAVASLVLTFILNFSCSLVQQQRSLFVGDNTNFTTCLSVPHFEVAGKTLGLIGGKGNIGSQVASLAKAFDMTILISTRDSNSIANSESGIFYTSSVEELLQRSDFISLHCPLNSATKHLINARSLSLMKPTAYIINTARGRQP
jgi:glycerate dehydrogenase